MLLNGLPESEYQPYLWVRNGGLDGVTIVKGSQCEELDPRDRPRWWRGGNGLRHSLAAWRKAISSQVVLHMRSRYGSAVRVRFSGRQFVSFGSIVGSGLSPFRSSSDHGFAETLSVSSSAFGWGSNRHSSGQAFGWRRAPSFGSRWTAGNRNTIRPHDKNRLNPDRPELAWVQQRCSHLHIGVRSIFPAGSASVLVFRQPWRPFGQQPLTGTRLSPGLIASPLAGHGISC